MSMSFFVLFCFLCGRGEGGRGDWGLNTNPTLPLIPAPITESCESQNFTEMYEAKK